MIFETNHINNFIIILDYQIKMLRNQQSNASGPLAAKQHSSSSGPALPPGDSVHKLHKDPSSVLCLVPQDILVAQQQSQLEQTSSGSQMPSPPMFVLKSTSQAQGSDARKQSIKVGNRDKRRSTVTFGSELTNSEVASGSMQLKEKSHRNSIPSSAFLPPESTTSPLTLLADAQLVEKRNSQQQRMVSYRESYSTMDPFQNPQLKPVLHDDLTTPEKIIASAKQLGEHRGGKSSPSAITFITLNVNKDLPEQSGKDIPEDDCAQNYSLKKDIARCAIKSKTSNEDIAHENGHGNKKQLQKPALQRPAGQRSLRPQNKIVKKQAKRVASNVLQSVESTDDLNQEHRKRNQNMSPQVIDFNDNFAEKLVVNTVGTKYPTAGRQNELKPTFGTRKQKHQQIEMGKKSANFISERSTMTQIQNSEKGKQRIKSRRGSKPQYLINNHSSDSAFDQGTIQSSQNMRMTQHNMMIIQSTQPHTVGSSQMLSPQPQKELTNDSLAKHFLASPSVPQHGKKNPRIKRIFSGPNRPNSGKATASTFSKTATMSAHEIPTVACVLSDKTCTSKQKHIENVTNSVQKLKNIVLNCGTQTSQPQAQQNEVSDSVSETGVFNATKIPATTLDSTMSGKDQRRHIQVVVNDRAVPLKHTNSVCNDETQRACLSDTKSFPEKTVVSSSFKSQGLQSQSVGGSAQKQLKIVLKPQNLEMIDHQQPLQPVSESESTQQHHLAPIQLETTRQTGGKKDRANVHLLYNQYEKNAQKQFILSSSHKRQMAASDLTEIKQASVAIQDDRKETMLKNEMVLHQNQLNQVKQSQNSRGSSAGGGTGVETSRFLTQPHSQQVLVNAAHRRSRQNLSKQKLKEQPQDQISEQRPDLTPNQASEYRMLVEKSKIVVSPATLDKYIAPMKRQFLHVPSKSIHFLSKNLDMHNHDSLNLSNRGKKDNFLSKVKKNAEQSKLKEVSSQNFSEHGSTQPLASAVSNPMLELTEAQKSIHSEAELILLSGVKRAIDQSQPSKRAIYCTLEGVPTDGSQDEMMSLEDKEEMLSSQTLQQQLTRLGKNLAQERQGINVNLALGQRQMHSQLHCNASSFDRSSAVTQNCPMESKFDQDCKEQQNEQKPKQVGDSKILPLKKMTTSLSSTVLTQAACLENRLELKVDENKAKKEKGKIPFRFFSKNSHEDFATENLISDAIQSDQDSELLVEQSKSNRQGYKAHKTDSRVTSRQTLNHKERQNFSTRSNQKQNFVRNQAPLSQSEHRFEAQQLFPQFKSQLTVKSPLTATNRQKGPKISNLRQKSQSANLQLGKYQKTHSMKQLHQRGTVSIFDQLGEPTGLNVKAAHKKQSKKRWSAVRCRNETLSKIAAIKKQKRITDEWQEFKKMNLNEQFSQDVKHNKMILRREDSNIKSELASKEQEMIASSTAFDSSIGKMLFVINQVNLENRPKRMLVSKSSKLASPTEVQYDQSLYNPKQGEGRLNKGGTFTSQDRFSKLPKEAQLPFYHKIGDPLSGFDEKKKRGVSFGKPREAISLESYSVPPQISTTSNKIALTSKKGQGTQEIQSKQTNQDANKGISETIIGPKLFLYHNDIEKITRNAVERLELGGKSQSKLKELLDKYFGDPSKFTNIDGKKPEEIDREVIEIVKSLQRCDKGKLKKLFGPDFNVQNADWSDFLLPKSITHRYQDHEYNKQVQQIRQRRRELGIYEPTDQEVLEEVKQQLEESVSDQNSFFLTQDHRLLLANPPKIGSRSTYRPFSNTFKRRQTHQCEFLKVHPRQASRLASDASRSPSVTLNKKSKTERNILPKKFSSQQIIKEKPGKNKDSPQRYQEIFSKDRKKNYSFEDMANSAAFSNKVRPSHRGSGEESNSIKRDIGPRISIQDTSDEQ